MSLRTAKIAVPSLVLLATLAAAQCPIKEILVEGRVENAPHDARVRVQLVYPKRQAGDSTETILAEDNFKISATFLTENRKTAWCGFLSPLEKCNRKPETVVITLWGSDPPQKYDRLSLDLPNDFKLSDSNTYTLRSGIVLHGP
jgi:hypothetical protein